MAVSPHLLSGGGSIPWLHLFLLLAGVVLIGLLAGRWLPLRRCVPR